MSDRTRSQEDPTPVSYEPPQIEQVLTEEVLTREVHYAGFESTDSADGSVDV